MGFLANCLVGAILACAQDPSAPRTVAEESGFEATSRYQDVIAFCEQLKKNHPQVTLLEIGKSREGRGLPLLVLGPAKTPEAARKTGKPIVLAFANIHAGEVDGKEAVLMLARDLLLAKAGLSLNDLVIVLVPILNADGNERVDVKNRREQAGPIKGVGIRENADGYDLNRDFIKLETPEIQSLVKAIREWDPDILVDLHTTNGSYHRFPITYDTPRNPGAQGDLIEAVRNQWMPKIAESMKAKTGFPIFFYGNFNRDRSAWETVPPIPRFGIQSFALRNRVGILSESYSYDPFEKRVKASYGFLHSILKFAAENTQEVKSRIKAASEIRDRVVLRTRQIPLQGDYRILGYVEESVNGRPKPTRQEKEYPVVCVQGAEATLTVSRPYAYLISSDFPNVLANLQNHGIEVEALTEPTRLSVGAFKVGSIQKARNPFQKHQLVQLEGTQESLEREFQKGTWMVKTNQPLGNLASYLLEPMAEDGLFTWNFFDEVLVENKHVPVFRLEKEQNLKSDLLKQK